LHILIIQIFSGDMMSAGGMIKDRKAKIGLFWTISATIGFSIIPILAKLGLATGLSAGILLFYRFFIATVFFFLYCLVRRIRFVLPKKVLLSVLLAGVIYSVQCLCYFSAFNYISAPLGAVLYNCYPIFVLLLSRMYLAEKITFPKLFAVIVTILGTVIVLYAPWGIPQIMGIALIIATAFISSVYMVYNKKFTSEIDSVVLTFYVCMICALCYLIHSLITNEFVIITNYTIWINVSLLAFWSTIIGLFGFMKAISLLNVALVSVITLAEPIFTIILSVIILSEALTIQQIIGGVVVIAGIYIYELKGN